jgi:hypothetical protein
MFANHQKDCLEKRSAQILHRPFRTAPIQCLNGRIKKQSDAETIALQILLLDDRYGV